MQEESSIDSQSSTGIRTAELPQTSDLHQAMLDASPDCIKVLTPEGLLIALSKSGCHALGLKPSEVSGVAWIQRLPQPVHDAAYEALAAAAGGTPSRFAGYSEGSGIVTFWDNLLTPVVDPNGNVDSIVCVSRDVTEKTLLEKKLEDSLAREQILTFEMQHRIKNVFTVTNSLVMIAEREARAAGDPAQIGRIMTEKLGALSRASDAVLTRSGLDKLDLQALADSVLKPFGAQCRVIGAEQFLDVELSNTLALFLHESATNSAKHGALSVPTGTVEIGWETDDQWLEIMWQECGGPAIEGPPSKQGFGSQLIDRIVSSAGGAVVKTWFATGLQLELKLPLTK
jgi:PAS domain S-box-containing protein